MRRRRLEPLALALLGYGLAFVQRPGLAVSDTRLELSADPALFLHRVIRLWDPTTDFGHVQGGQFNGYLFPMAPWFALGHALGLPMWVVQRLWLGTLLFIAAWGVVRLLRALLPRAGAIECAGAALLFVLNPYVVQFTSRGTVTLLTYAALPWLVLAVHRGVRAPRRWRWPAVVGLIITSTGGGVNAAVLAFALIGPVALALYELAIRETNRRAVWQFAWRAALASAVASAWWVIPVLLQGRYGQNFLLYTEQPATIWGTTSMSELLRLLGFWGLYTGVGYGHLVPFMGVGGTYLFSPFVVIGTFAVPLLGLGTLRWTRTWRYAPFFVGLAVIALLVMFCGWPDGTRFHATLLHLYDAFPAGQFLRTTYKAAPLLALSLACLGGVAAARMPRWTWAPLLAVPVLAGLPLVTGKAIDRAQAYGSVPAPWRAALAAADRAQGGARGRFTRTMILPGELFGSYTWGNTMDPVGPAVSARPVAIREIVPYADPRSAQLQVAVDDLVGQGRLVPGQLAPLLRLLGVGQVLVARDSNPQRSSALDPVSVAQSLAGQSGLESAASYGPRRRFGPSSGRSGPMLTLPELSRLSLAGAPAPGGVTLHPTGGETILEGDQEGVAELSATGSLDLAHALLLAGDVGRARLRSLAAGGARLVFSDSARRRVFVAPRLQANRGPTQGALDPEDPEAPRFNPFPQRGTDGQTVATYTGLKRLWAPLASGFSQLPQFRPYMALDGRLDTEWRADENVRNTGWVLHVDLAQPLRVKTIGIYPQSDRYGRTEQVAVSVNGGSERRLTVHPGRNPFAVNATLGSIAVRVTRIGGPKDTRGGGGLDELEIPGLHVHESLRLPTALATEARGLDLRSSPIDVILARTTADFPTRAGVDPGYPKPTSLTGMRDAEPGLEREIDLPVARRFALSGWASVSPTAPDGALDRLAGLAPGWRYSGSTRFEGVPGRRASSAFDGDPRTAWIGDVVPGRVPFLGWRAPRPVLVRSLRLVPGPPGYGTAAEVRINGRPAAVGLGGAVLLPHPLRARSFRIDITRVRAGARRDLRAVAISEVSVPGMRFAAPRRRGRFTTGCAAFRAAGPTGSAGVGVSGTLADLDAGRPLRLRGCGALALPAGSSHLSVGPGPVMRPDHLVLRSPAPDPLATAALAPGRVESVGGDRRDPPTRARLDVTRPSWLVLDQSYSRGWRASCDGRSLGAPTPVDGYANGWRVDPGCRNVSFSFAPEKLARAGFAVSGIGVVVLLMLALLGARRAPRPEEVAGRAPAGDPVVRPGRVLLGGLALAALVLGGYLFAIRLGVALAVLVVVVGRWGVSVRRLGALAAAGIAILPVLYLVFPAKDKGGFSFEFASQHLDAAFVADLVVCALGVAAVVGIRRLRRLAAAHGPTDHA